MPHKLCDCWYEDLPEAGKKAAAILGWTKETWDADEDSPYDAKDFKDCTIQEKQAALYLGMDPLKSKKLDVWWNELDEETQKQALVLTWTKAKWDDDWELHHLEAEHWWWKDMTDEQKAAARHFGYAQPTWDQTGEPVDFDGVDVPASSSGKKPNKKKQDEKKEGDKPGKKTGDGDGKDASKKKKFITTRFYGGQAGTEFDQRNHRWIESVEVFSGGSIVNGLKVSYSNHVVEKAGAVSSGKAHKLTLEPGEFINKVTVRADDHAVQELTFHTNKGQSQGPWGGHGRMLKDKKGEVHEVQAPRNAALCGFLGRQTPDKHIDAIAFRWGPAADHASRK